MGRGVAKRRWIVGVAAALCLTACTSGASSTPTPAATVSALPSATPTATARPSPTPVPTPASSPSGASNTFESTRYKYALTLPPGTTLLGWRAAERAWDGQARVDMAGSYVDRTSVAEGGLLVIGAEADSLDTFFTQFVGNGTRFHGCTEARNVTDVTISGTPAIAFTQVCAGVAAFGRVAMFNDGHGVGAWIVTTPGKELAARDRLVELLAGLEWRTD